MAVVPYRSTFARLLGFLRPYRGSLVVSTVLAVGSQAAQIALIWVTGRVVDHAIRPRDSHELWIFVWTIVGLGTVKALLMTGRRLISGRQALGVEMDMRNGLYARLVRLFFVEWRLALIALAVTPLLVVLAYRYSRVAHPTLRDVQQKLADVATVAQENIVGVNVVKAFAQEPAEEAKFDERSEAVFQQTLTANRQRALYVPLISFLPLLAQAAVLLAGARMVSHGSLSVGGFVAFNLYLGMLIMPLRSLGMWIGQAQRATASGERIFQVMDEPEEVADRPGATELPPGPGHVHFERVSFEYLTGRPVLRDVDLE